MPAHLGKRPVSALLFLGDEGMSVSAMEDADIVVRVFLTPGPISEA